MAENKKKKSYKKNSTKKQSNTVNKKKTASKKSINTKNNKKNNIAAVKKNQNIKEKDKKVIEPLKEESNIMLDLKKLKEVYNDKKKNLVNKYKAFSKPVRYLIVVSFICLLVLILEGIVFVSTRRIRTLTIVYHDSYSSVTVDDGNVIVVGNSDFDSNKNKKENVRGKLIKYNNSGDIIFETTYEKGLTTSFNSVITVSDGYVVVGTGIFSEEEKNNGAKEAFIIKYDKDGTLIWEKFYQVLTNTSFNKVKETSDGYIVVGGSIYANMELGNHNTGGGIIVKYDKEGNEIWHNNHGGSKSGNFNDFVAADDGIYVVGKDGADSANLVKFSVNGEYLWHKNYSYTDSFGFGGIAYLDNSLFVVGSKKILREGITENDDRSTSNTDAVLLKYDLDGNLVMEKTFGGSSYERYNSILLYHGNFYVVGHICSHDAGLKVTGNIDAMTGLVVRYDRNGNILKKETFGGSNNDNLTGIATDGISFFAVGYSNSDDGSITTNRSNGKDYVGELIKLNSRFKKIYSK